MSLVTSYRVRRKNGGYEVLLRTSHPQINGLGIGPTRLSAETDAFKKTLESIDSLRSSYELLLSKYMSDIIEMKERIGL